MKKIRESVCLIIAGIVLIPIAICSSLSIVNDSCEAWSIINAILSTYALIFLHGLLNGVEGNENKKGPKSVRAINVEVGKMLLIHSVTQLGILVAGLITTAYGLDGIIPMVGLATEFLLVFAIYDACKGIASSVVPHNEFDWTINLLKATIPGLLIPICVEVVMMRVNLIIIVTIIIGEVFLAILAATCAGRELAYAEEE